MVCHIVKPFAPTALCENSDCRVIGLVWDHWLLLQYHSGSSLRLHSAILLLLRGMEVLQLWLSRSSPFALSVHERCRCSSKPTQSPEFGPGWQLTWLAHQLSHAHATVANSSALPRREAGPTVRGWVLQPVRGRATFPAPMSQLAPPWPTSTQCSAINSTSDDIPYQRGSHDLSW